MGRTDAELKIFRAMMTMFFLFLLYPGDQLFAQTDDDDLFLMLSGGDGKNKNRFYSRCRRSR